MENRNYIKAKVLILIPVAVFVYTVICMVLASILEVPTNRGTLYSIVAFMGLMSMFLSPLPCLVMSIIGTVFAGKASKEGERKAHKFLVIGIIEILPAIACVILAIAMFIGGQSV